MSKNMNNSHETNSEQVRNTFGTTHSSLTYLIRQNCLGWAIWASEAGGNLKPTHRWNDRRWKGNSAVEHLKKIANEGDFVECPHKLLQSISTVSSSEKFSILGNACYVEGGNEGLSGLATIGNSPSKVQSPLWGLPMPLRSFSPVSRFPPRSNQQQTSPHLYE